MPCIAQSFLKLTPRVEEGKKNLVLPVCKATANKEKSQVNVPFAFCFRLLYQMLLPTRINFTISFPFLALMRSLYNFGFKNLATGSYCHRKYVASPLLSLPGNMYLSRDNVVAHIVREIFLVATVASNNSLVSEIYRLLGCV